MRKPMVWHGHDLSGFLCLGSMFSLAILDVVTSILTSPFRRRSETPTINMVETPENLAILEHMPAVRVFSPPFWAVGHWAQTVIGGSQSPRNPLPYRREVLHLDDGVTVTLDYKEKGLLPADAPLVLILHGLGGHSMTNSCNGMSEALARDGRYRVVVYNRRGHGGQSLLPSMTSFAEEDPEGSTATDTDEEASSSQVHVSRVKAFPRHVDLEDIRAVVRHVAQRHPDAPKVLLGLSAGANLAVYYQGAFGDESPFSAVVSVSNGHEVSQLTTALLQRPIADWMLTTFLKNVLYARWDEVHRLAAQAGVKVDWAAVLRQRHTRPFESLLTAPVYGYSSVDDYYRDNSSCYLFPKIGVPLLSLANADDPIIAPQLITHAQDAARSNPHIISVATRRGGHLGWLHGPTARPWMHGVVREYIAAVLGGQAGKAKGA